jgi:hypothetical protein
VSVTPKHIFDRESIEALFEEGWRIVFHGGANDGKVWEREDAVGDRHRKKLTG